MTEIRCLFVKSKRRNPELWGYEFRIQRVRLVRQGEIDALTAWMVEHIGPQQMDWWMHGAQIIIRTDEHAMAFRLRWC